MITRFEPELAAQYVAVTQGTRPNPSQAERTASVAAGMTRTLTTTAADSLFDTEPDQLQATLVALADDGVSA